MSEAIDLSTKTDHELRLMLLASLPEAAKFVNADGVIERTGNMFGPTDGHLSPYHAVTAEIASRAIRDGWNETEGES